MLQDIDGKSSEGVIGPKRLLPDRETLLYDYIGKEGRGKRERERQRQREGERKNTQDSAFTAFRRYPLPCAATC